MGGGGSGLLDGAVGGLKYVGFGSGGGGVLEALVCVGSGGGPRAELSA